MLATILRLRTTITPLILGGCLYTGYWIQDKFIWGPRESGKFWIENSWIWGPRNSGKYWIDDKFIWGPKDSGKFWIEDGFIYGPHKNLPWLD